MHGPGRKWTIMARPRTWERGNGRVPNLIPRGEYVLAVKQGTMTHEEYKAHYIEKIRHHELHPGGLWAYLGEDGVWGTPVSDGDTLCCACSRQNANEGRCHRAWAAQALHEAGWVVVLDGKRLGDAVEPEEEEFPDLF